MSHAHSVVNPTYKLQPTEPSDYPDEVKQSLEHVGWPNLGQVAIMEGQAVENSGSQVTARYDLRIPYSAMKISSHGMVRPWSFFGWPIRIHDASGMVETLLEKDSKTLQKKANSLRLVGYRGSVAPMVRENLKPALHRDILAKHVAGADLKKISMDLGQAVSPEYVKSFLFSMRSAILGGNIRLLIMQLALSILLLEGVLAALVGVVNQKGHPMYTPDMWQWAFYFYSDTGPWFTGPSNQWLSVFPSEPGRSFGTLVILALGCFAFAWGVRRLLWASWMGKLTKGLSKPQAKDFLQWVRVRTPSTAKKWPSVLVFLVFVAFVRLIIMSAIPIGVDVNGDLYGIPGLQILGWIDLHHLTNPYTNNLFGLPPKPQFTGAPLAPMPGFGSDRHESHAERKTWHHHVWHRPVHHEERRAQTFSQHDYLIRRAQPGQATVTQTQ